MALETRDRPLMPELALPPPFTLVRLRELGDAFAHAVSIAPIQGAGTLVYVGRFDLAEFALVLEPEQPLVQARRAFYAGMVALSDALITHAEPETAITIEWPDAILVNRGFVGGARLAWPNEIEEDETPPWLVFGAMIRTVSMSGAEPGLSPLVTALAEEGFSNAISERVVESFARHLMSAVDAWQARGFGVVARSYLERMPVEQGLSHDISENGDLLVRRKGKLETERKKFLPRLAAPAWFDPTSNGPRE